MVEGEVRHVFVEPGTNAKREIPDDIRRALEPYVADAAASSPPRPARAPGRRSPRSRR